MERSFWKQEILAQRPESVGVPRWRPHCPFAHRGKRAQPHRYQARELGTGDLPIGDRRGSRGLSFLLKQDASAALDRPLDWPNLCSRPRERHFQAHRIVSDLHVPAAAWPIARTLKSS